MAQDVDVKEQTVSTRIMELVVSGLFIVFSCVVLSDSWRIGARWGSDGPQAGYFPFFVGAIMLIASAVTFVTNLLASGRIKSNFVDRSALILVLKVFLPTVVYVALIGFLGIYVSSAIFIAFFMAWLGKYPVHKIVPVAILVPIALFIMFDVWFLVPLPKGPLETALGY